MEFAPDLIYYTAICLGCLVPIAGVAAFLTGAIWGSNIPHYKVEKDYGDGMKRLEREK